MADGRAAGHREACGHHQLPPYAGSAVPPDPLVSADWQKANNTASNRLSLILPSLGV